MRNKSRFFYFLTLTSAITSISDPASAGKEKLLRALNTDIAPALRCKAPKVVIARNTRSDFSRARAVIAAKAASGGDAEGSLPLFERLSLSFSKRIPAAALVLPVYCRGLLPNTATTNTFGRNFPTAAVRTRMAWTAPVIWRDAARRNFSTSAPKAVASLAGSEYPVDSDGVLPKTARNRVLIVKGQGIGPECIVAAKKVLAATGIDIDYTDGSLGYPDAKDLFPLLQQRAPQVYARHYGEEDPLSLAGRLEAQAKEEARAAGNINDFYKKLLGKLKPEVLKEVKAMVVGMEKETLKAAQGTSAVLKGALRTLDEGDEPSRNVTVRKAFEQYANIRRCVTLNPIAPGAKGADILFVRENVEDLYASIEHRLSRNYPQALRHQTPEGCELICRAAFEAALRDGRKKVTALEKPNILKITGGLFKETFLRVAKDYNKDKLGKNAIEAQFMIIDDGLAAIAATPEKFDVVVTSNMFGDIGSDVAAKVTGGVGLVSSNNTNPNNPRAVSMFETMGGTADDIAGQNQANPLALIDAAAEMLLHMGGRDNMMAAEMIKAATLQVLAEGYYVGDIKKGPYQESRGKEKLGTQEFAEKIADAIRYMRVVKSQNPEKTFKQIALDTAGNEVRTLFGRVLGSYEQYADNMRAGHMGWVQHITRNVPPNPVRARSRIVGFDFFVDDSGMRPVFAADGRVDRLMSRVDPATSELFKRGTGIDISHLFNEGMFGSVQSLRSFGQYSARALRSYLDEQPGKVSPLFGQALREMGMNEAFYSRFSEGLSRNSFRSALGELENFDRNSIRLIQSFYCARAQELEPTLGEHGFKLARITSRGTEIYPTMCDFEKRQVDRYRVEMDPLGPLANIANDSFNHAILQVKIAAIQGEMAKRGWMVAETILNRNFIDGEGPRFGVSLPGVSVPYARDLGTNYAKKPMLPKTNPRVKFKEQMEKVVPLALEQAGLAIKEAGLLIKEARDTNQVKIAQTALDNLLAAQKVIVRNQGQIARQKDDKENIMFEEIEGAITTIQENAQNIFVMVNHNKL